MNNGLYVHIPFCGAICHYCDFVKFVYEKKWVKPYISALHEDLQRFEVPFNLHTIYVGGGTPSALSYYELKALLELLKPYTAQLKEYTFEANIESITAAKLLLLQKYGVNRLSIGVQSTNDQRLDEMNRKHTYKDIKVKLNLVKQTGFTNFSVDLIYGLPNQSEEELAKDIENILLINPPHLATYALTIEPNTVAFIKKWPTITDEKSRKMYDQILFRLRRHGYERYEVSNFAKPGFESIHNMLYWRNQNYYGIGLGAAGYVGNQRYIIKGGLKNYLRLNSRLENEIITPTMFIEEYFMLNLRLQSGFSVADFSLKTGVDFEKVYSNQIKELITTKLVTLNEGIFKCTDEGIMLLDTVVLTLIS